MENAKRRNKPYVWVTWITGLLSGTDRCTYRAWVKANYQLPKAESSGSEDTSQLDKWIEEHDAMTAARVPLLKAEGWNVGVEDHNSFKLEGAAAVLGGKPDIVAVKPDRTEALIVDEKSGKAKEKYFWQVLIYMFAMKRTHLKGVPVIRGEIEYKGNTVHVPHTELGAFAEQKIGQMMQTMGNRTAPSTVPSASECRFCDVVGCPDRFLVRNEVADASDLF